MRSRMILLLGLAVVVGCSSDPTASAEYQDLERQHAEAVALVEAADVEYQALEQQHAEALVAQDALVEVAPFHAIPADAVVVSGTAACDLSGEGVSAEGETGSLLVVCELDMSDTRVSGTERHDRFRVHSTPHGSAWLVEEAVITNAKGSWRGSAQAAENNAAIPSGEAHYIGEGAYEGLEFHYYFFHPELDDKAELRGWISASE